ncbi:LAFE_0H05600g1_1 [Lachancea fermentati]|uniref:LAFE_0H05600g1_1 n=1 Tax=Lachancea fermentati TaxID=4955 RepID=A0A1G4MJN6_LACFM|nr:LAFE_0H05600g1_1 [Lachancea fermentati]
MAVHNPNNWHWVDKNCIDWARKYFKEHLVGVHAGQEGDRYITVSSVSSVEGDCEVNQRKGKVISLFDLKIVMMIKGNVDDQVFEGSITVPEVAFDSELDDYQFEISIYKETAKLNEAKPVIRSELIPQLKDIFSKFGSDLLLTHGNDIQVPEDQVKSQYTKANQQNSFAKANPSAKESKGTGTTSTTTASSKSESSASPSASGTTGKYNSTTLHLEPTFNVPAIELYQTFVDKQRIMAWSRSQLICESSDAVLKQGDEFTFFGGNITSKLVECDPGKRLVFNWRLNEWHKGYFSTIKMDFHESQEYHETKLQVTWSGVPIGEEDKVRGNFEEYYVRSIKITFGFGAVL